MLVLGKTCQRVWILRQGWNKFSRLVNVAVWPCGGMGRKVGFATNGHSVTCNSTKLLQATYDVVCANSELMGCGPRVSYTKVLLKLF